MKRLIDLLFVLLVLPAWVPLVLCLWIWIRMVHGAPVFYHQVRAGLNGKPFTIIKFRSMTEERDASGALLSDAERLTPLGRWLRSWSLDELPELVHVCTGKMSLVGPRPLPVRYIDRYSPEQARRLEVRPGITGWAQVNGRNATSWEARFRQDVWYVEHQSLLLDLRILAMTVFKVLGREGITHENAATMHEFMGSPPDRDS